MKHADRLRKVESLDLDVLTAAIEPHCTTRRAAREAARRWLNTQKGVCNLAPSVVQFLLQHKGKRRCVQAREMVAIGHSEAYAKWAVTEFRKWCNRPFKLLTE